MISKPVSLFNPKICTERVPNLMSHCTKEKSVQIHDAPCMDDLHTRLSHFFEGTQNNMYTYNAIFGLIQ